MSSILERPNLNKIFLIYGNLDDMFITPDLQKNNFRPFLNAYLKSLGYERIVFYSGAKNTGKYVLDEQSAVLAINKNKNISTASGGQQNESTKKKRRILNPNAKKDVENTQSSSAQAERNDNTPNSENKPAEKKIVYKQPKITPAEFLDEAKNMMADQRIKTAIIFTFFQDFVTDSSAPLQQYSELLSHLWDEYSLNNNENICIFLAPQMDGDSLSDLFDSLTSGNVFKNRFFNDNKTINKSCTIQIGLPNSDELTYMLDYLRIVGEGGKRITFSRSRLPKILSLLMYLSREAEAEENRAGYLSAIYENIVWYIKHQSEKVVLIDEDVVKKIYSRYTSSDAVDPMEKLSTTRGWESVAKRINDIVTDFKQKKARALAENPIREEKRDKICSNERIDTKEDISPLDYKIPNFVLKGNPGVGKTTVARLIGQIFYEAGILQKGQTIEATRDDLVDRFVGGTTAKTRDCIMRSQESVLFIDDAYSLIDKSEENNYPKQAIDELVAAMTNTRQYRFCLIMAGYPQQMDELLKMNSGLTSRFGAANILTIEDYPPEVLKSIFVNECKKNGYKITDSEDTDEKVDLDLFFKNLYDQRDRANFGNARVAVSIANDVKMQSSLRDDNLRIINRSDFGLYDKYFDSHGVSTIDEIYAEIDRYVGFDFVKEMFDNIRLELLDIEDCKKRGVKPDSYADHYIFAGNAGTGKTTVGKMIGNFYYLMGVMGGKETIFVDASELIGTHVGDSKNRVLEKIQEAIDHNSILYIDEAYQIADTAYSSEIVGAMMTKMTENADDFKMIFGMYKNRVDDFLKLNAGLNRRIRIVEFPDYTPDQLTEIFDRSIKAQGRTISDEAHRQIQLIMEYKYNTRTDSFGNAGDVKKLVGDMKKLQLKRVSKQDSLSDEERYQYTPEDIPEAERESIKDLLEPRSFDDIMKELNERIGMSDLKSVILSKADEIEYAKRCGGSSYDINPGYYFFVGNAGTGKSTSAALFAECLRELGVVKTNKFYSCTAKDLVGEYLGQTSGKTYEVLKNSINGVLFIDEAYSLSYADDPHSGQSFKKEALEQIIAFMDEPEHRRRCCIIFAGYEKDMQGLYKSNSGMRSRIEEVHFNDYTGDELYSIFELFCKKAGYKLEEGVKEYYMPIFEKLTGMEYYSNGRTARTIFEKTIGNLKHRVIHSKTITPETNQVILLSDLLTEDECISIVATN